ncbi:hypothetical protein [Ruegeria lacuscaerulensis]|uniref:hypothetical protein n=1 Tax=Ruegeria lacuscaerulensis TaxID=55218 RepID=UPI00148034D1|nr:hypothetical protein [Ruegeria lacuscaerulensis]
MQKNTNPNWRSVVFTLASFILVLPLIVWLPQAFGHAPGVISTAQAEGYNNRIAHITTVLWIFFTVTGVWVLSRGAEFSPRSPAQSASKSGWAATLLLPLLVFIAIVFAYFPPALAPSGPFFEESIHLTALHRMLGGDVPYQDFEFLYGPLMLYPAYWWTKLTSFSLVSFYTYVMILELLVMLALLIPIQTYISSFWARLGAFLLLSSLYFNTMLGPNQNGLRKLAGVLILISVAHRPFHTGLCVLHGIALGLLLSYSQDFGAATAIGIFAIYASIFAKLRDWRAITALLLTAGISFVIWVGCLWLLLGPAVGDYFSVVRYLTGQFDAGEAAFRFYWTASGLAVFALVLIAIWLTGSALSRNWIDTPGPSDLLIIGALAYAAILLKSGLSRADQWHLVPSVLPIAFCLILPLRASYAPIANSLRGLGIALTLILALTYTFGQFTIARYVFRDGLLANYQAMISGQLARPDTIVNSVQQNLLREKSDPDENIVELSRFLSEPPQRGKPVFAYDRLWSLPAKLGVSKVGFLTDNYIYGDERGQLLRQMLNENPDVLVVIDRESYDWMSSTPDDAPPPPGNHWVSRGKYGELRAMLASVHVPAVPLEAMQMRTRWRRLVGNYLMGNYAPIFSNDRFVLLERSENDPADGSD